MDRRYEISQLFKLAFGVSSPVYLTVPIGKRKDPEITYPTIPVKESELEEADRLSRFGTPIVFPVKFLGGYYKNYDSKGKLFNVQYSDFWFPPATMVDFSLSKVITNTNVIGGDGTVKEIFGFDDWDIRIRTICITDEISARDYEKKIIEWFRAVQSIKVEGALFTTKDIHSITLDNIDVKSIEGSPNVIPIELSCSSDKPIDLLL
ncbi:DUF6046 domain-containing protein [Chryseobacterium sp.]|uniref:DUF6046 domain-containing protein n=1 Tax=Chryseobacterium sp. TaxID=1871047 RepID=UPI002897F4B2|nr:DUF6046 domain-containing protein [Chryseobacterium sp.]